MVSARVSSFACPHAQDEIGARSYHRPANVTSCDSHFPLPEARVNPLVKNRDMMVQVILFVITCGIYGIYWFYQTAVEMKALTRDSEAEPGLWTVLLFIPFANFYAHYRYSELFERVSDDHLNKWILFILWIVFCPAVWFIVQTDLNKKAG